MYTYRKYAFSATSYKRGIYKWNMLLANRSLSCNASHNGLAFKSEILLSSEGQCCWHRRTVSWERWDAFVAYGNFTLKLGRQTLVNTDWQPSKNIRNQVTLGPLYNGSRETDQNRKGLWWWFVLMAITMFLSWRLHYYCYSGVLPSNRQYWMGVYVRY